MDSLRDLLHFPRHAWYYDKVSLDVVTNTGFEPAPDCRLMNTIQAVLLSLGGIHSHLHQLVKYSSSRSV